MGSSSRTLSTEKSTALVVGGIGSIALLYWMNRRRCSMIQRCAPKVDSSDKTVLVIGGGIGGLTAIAGLRKYNSTVKIVLVEPKDHCEIYWASYRSPFEEWVREGSLILLQDFLTKHNVTHVRTKVTKLTNDTATLNDGKQVSFDVCVIATGAGSYWPGMGRGPPASAKESTRSYRVDALKAEGDDILNSNHVVIIGGGLIGTELAGDVSAYSQKNKTPTRVTLIHSGSQLCPIMSQAAATVVQQQLESLGVEILLDEKAKQDNKDNTLTLSNGSTIQDADKVIWTTGFVPLNSFLRDTLPEALDENGWILTDQYFRIKGSNGRLFAVGDCTTTLPNAGNQVMRNMSILGNNIHQTLVGNTDDTVLQKLSLGVEVYCNTTGPDQGVFYSSFLWTRRVLPWIKNSTMFFMSPKDTIGLT